MMNLPVLNYRTERTINPVNRKRSEISATQTLNDPLECFNLCAANTKTKNCLTWTFDNATKICYLYESPLMNLNNFNDTTQSGLMGNWSKLSGLDCLNYHVESPAVGPSGDIASCILTDSTNAISFTTSNRASEIFTAARKPGSSTKSNFQQRSPHGVSVFNTNLEAGQSTNVTFLLAWYYPNRDFFGKTFGNQYMHFFNSIGDVVNYVQQNQQMIVNDIFMLNGAFTNSSMDEFLQDIFINSLSHIRSAMWFGDSR